MSRKSLVVVVLSLLTAAVTTGCGEEKCVCDFFIDPLGEFGAAPKVHSELDLTEEECQTEEERVRRITGNGSCEIQSVSVRLPTEPLDFPPPEPSSMHSPSPDPVVFPFENR